MDISRLPSWFFGLGLATFVYGIRQAIEKRRTYARQLLPFVAKHGFEIVSSTPLPWLSTGPFPKVHVFSQPYVKTETPLGSGEFVKYRRLVLTDVSHATYTTCVLLEFKAFMLSTVLFDPALESLRSKPVVTAE